MIISIPGGDHEGVLMRLCRIIGAIVMAGACSGCASITQVFSDAFINNYDGAGCFSDQIVVDHGDLSYIDSLDTDAGFDSVCVLHLRVFDRTQTGNLADQLRGVPEIHYGLGAAYIQSDEAVRDEIRRRGNLARYFKDYAHGQWNDGIRGVYYDVISVVGVRSRIGTVVLQNVYLRFSNDRWMEIPVGVEFMIEPDGIYYLGTLAITLGEDIDGGLRGDTTFEILDSDGIYDMDVFAGHFPRIYERMGQTFHFPKWL